MSQSRKTFVLVADASRARLFSTKESAPNITLVESFDHPESRAKIIDLMADKPGRTFESGPTNHARSSKEYRTNPKRVEAEKFARALGDRLATLLEAQAFDDLVIAAPSKFLGLLRSTLATRHDNVSNCVVAWHEKNFTQLVNLADLSERLSIADLPRAS